MTHVFVAPHPDDVALSCGGLIASLRELGQNVTILTVFSGDGASDRLTPYQREALGFGSKAMWPATEAFNRSAIARRLADRRPRPGLGGRRTTGSTRPRPTPTRPPSGSGSARRGTAGRASATSRWPTSRSMDDLPTQGAVYTDDVVDAAAAGDLMARRRLEDERFAYFAEASIVFLDLPDAVFRGYEGDERAAREPRADDDAPFELLRQEIARLEPQKVYLPLGVGGHVDHQLCREVGVRLLQEGRRWVMPGPGLRRHRHVLRGLPVRLVERLPAARRPARGAARRAAGRHRRHRRVTPTSPTSSNARSWASTSTRASSSGCSTAPARWPTRSGPTAARWPSSARSTVAPSGTGRRAASDAADRRPMRPGRRLAPPR